MRIFFFFLSVSNNFIAHYFLHRKLSLKFKDNKDSSNLDPYRKDLQLLMSNQCTKSSYQRNAETELTLKQMLVRSMEEYRSLCVQDALWWLERSICFAAVDRNLDDFYCLFSCYRECQYHKEGKGKAAFEELLQKLNLTQKHIDEAECLKKCEKFYVDFNRPPLTRSEWTAQIKHFESEKILNATLVEDQLKALEYFCPLPSDPSKPWEIVDPLEPRPYPKWKPFI